MSANDSSVVLNISLSKLVIDDSLKQGLIVSFAAEGITSHFEYPLYQPVRIGLRHIESNVRVSFVLHDNEIASGYLAVPEHKGQSLSFTDRLSCTLKNVYVENTKFLSEFAVEAEYLGNATKHLDEEPRQEAANSMLVGSGYSPLKSSIRGTGQLISQGETSPLRERVNPSHPTKADKTYKFKEEELHNYLSRVVSSHMH